ncbi:DUF4389 domain-containing protein [Marinospirillum sp. MEB164]|uniref:DUF4389 domain-containing protein n=1 Tax=Marinospirillum alkalitolerans TaxID=3123374 RepID=A0ABW8PY06_9GAMM
MDQHQNEPKADLKQRLKDEGFWLRLPFMLLFFVAWKLAELVLFGVIFVQLVYRLVTGSPQPQLQALGSQLALYGYQIYRYLTMSAESKPFPFADWPDAPPVEKNPYLPDQPTPSDAQEKPAQSADSL